jgi:hypothetical protein
MRRRDLADDLASTLHHSRERQSLLRFRRMVRKVALEPERESAACVRLLGIEREGAPRWVT